MPTEKRMVCCFCGATATTKEHVVPAWLQKKANLWNQHLGLWNGTPIRYRHAVVPACGTCNNERLSRLEHRVANRSASAEEYYIWALKVAHGLMQRDASLPMDRREPRGDRLFPRHMAEADQSLVWHVIRGLDDDSFRFEPSPFGSVLTFDDPRATSSPFDFVHLPPPMRALGIVLPEGQVLCVLFADRGVVKRLINARGSGSESLAAFFQLEGRVDLRFLMFWLVRLQKWCQIPSRCYLDPHALRSEPVPDKIPRRPARREVYERIAADCGLEPSVGAAIFDREGPEILAGEGVFAI